MSKLLTMLMAGALALTLSGFAAAQNQPADAAAGGATNTPPAMSEEGSAGKPTAGGATDTPPAVSEEESAGKAAAGGVTNTPPAMSEEESAGKAAAGDVTAPQGEQEYLAALKKCEALTGTDKSTCVEAAKKKLGEM